MRKRNKSLREDAADKANLYGLEKMSSATKQALDSADDQIDSYILRFESESIKNSSEDEIIMEMLRSRSLRLLFEAEGDEPEESTGPEGSETPKEKPEGVSPKPPLDIDAFTKKIARLVMNYRNLLRVEPVIVNRAAAFLEKNYGDKGKDYVERMVDILDTQFDFNLEGEEETIDVPIAAGAGVKSTGA